MKFLKQIFIYFTIFFMCLLFKSSDIPQWIIDHSWIMGIALVISYALYSLFDILDGKR